MLTENFQYLNSNELWQHKYIHGELSYCGRSGGFQSVNRLTNDRFLVIVSTSRIQYNYIRISIYIIYKYSIR